MQPKILPGYEGGVAIGQRKLWVVTAIGPASYSQTTGDVVSFAINEYIDFIAEALTISKTYTVSFIPAVTGNRQVWTARWFVNSTGAEVGNGVSLVGESIQTVIFGGEF